MIPQMIPFDHGSNLEKVGNAEGHRFHDSLDYTAIYGTKKAHEHWAHGLFFTIVSGGAGGSRTRVQTRTNRAFYMFILQLIFDRRLITDNPPGGLVQ